MNEDLLNAVKKAHRVYICGNGGSAANAIHIANDLVSVGIKAHALTADIATLTAIANDFGYSEVFSRQLAVLAEPGDMLIVLSGSGRSPNIIAALDTAERMGVDSWAIFGNFGSPSLLGADHTFNIGDNMQAAEEAQLFIGHELMLALKEWK